MRRPDYYLFTLLESLLGARRAEAAVLWMARCQLNNPRVRRNATRNVWRILAYANGREPDPSKIESVIAEMASLYGRTMIEHYTLPRDPALFTAISSAPFLDPLRRLLARGRGVILASPHFGNETMIYAVAAYHGIPVTVMVNEATQYRWPTGILKDLRFIGLGEGAACGLRRLANGEVLYLNTDLDYFPDDRTAPFFGAPFHPPQGVARMALASACPILPVYAVLESDRYAIESDEPIEAGPAASQEAIETRLLKSMETRISRNPSHWLVLHDMWNLDSVQRELRWQLGWIWARRRLALRWRAGRAG